MAIFKIPLNTTLDEESAGMTAVTNNPIPNRNTRDTDAILQTTSLARLAKGPSSDEPALA